ncbi:hypothetical protein [Acidiplasma cupricumulans]|uniref:hypothetical protein n=1 Tax=Acidiplasma cupricumulans TaxID=312540 RepID=UPI0015854A72|nr:hypothetical protein [Acidiplasma cupricumulans]
MAKYKTKNNIKNRNKCHNLSFYFLSHADAPDIEAGIIHPQNPKTSRTVYLIKIIVVPSIKASYPAVPSRYFIANPAGKTRALRDNSAEESDM